MRENQNIDYKNRFVINNYGQKGTFSNFLPGVSGENGIPLWCFYVNRGQCISCFGLQDKDHSIMQFYPAHQAYTHTKRLGFRTFIKLEGKVVEAFSKESNPHTMAVGMNELEIIENLAEEGLKVNVRYYTLPGEQVGALVRCVTIENKDEVAKEVEIVDGMPTVIPYGISLMDMNDMGQTAKAWMEAMYMPRGVAIFKTRTTLGDSAQVGEVAGANFAFALSGEGERLPVIVNAENVFGFDTSLETPHQLQEKSMTEMLAQEQITQNIVPCSFFCKAATLGPGENITLYEVYGQVEHIELLEAFQSKVKSTQYFKDKYEEAIELTERITHKIETHTGNLVFDLYCKQTYLDNVLRGGEPIILGSNKVFYVFSRKHGDMERDYNYFTMLPEMYSQGNGNFRDVNQNRRCDTRFSPYVGKQNIKLFYNAIQIDGYNPLGIEKITYYLREEEAAKYGEMADFLMHSFTPGKLYQKLMAIHQEQCFDEIMSAAVDELNTLFIDGYWSDHWTYNLDLIEEYLAIFPDKEKELFFEDEDYTYTAGDEFLLPARKRYKETDKGIRQYYFLEKNTKNPGEYIYTQDGEILTSSLVEKMLVLATLKFTALDIYGMGIEMEGGKPGWYDALNGLPGLLGSSMSETYELARNLEFLIRLIAKYEADISVFKELGLLIEQLETIVSQYKDELEEGESILQYWRAVATIKERYVESIKENVSSEKMLFESKRMIDVLQAFLNVVQKGIHKAIVYGKGICPTYFYYTVTAYEKTKDGIEIQEVKVENMPYFLEGPVRFLKQNIKKEEKVSLYNKIKASDLYDKQLKMYKVNTSLKDTTFEVGRAKSFTPGWLENESIWLHMAYKYLLEVLKSGLYEAYIDDFKRGVVPFLDAKTYGRSLLENSSFIASSANPNKALHGKGFVARLSGSTVEFLNMWQIMMFGKTPFTMVEDALTLAFKPLIPSYLINSEKQIEATFLGKTKVIYYLDCEIDYIPGQYNVTGYEVLKDDQWINVQGERISGELCRAIRDGKVGTIKVYLKTLMN